MASLNKVQLIGRLGQDVKLAYTQSSIPVGNFSMATDESYKDREGQKVERTEWHKVVVWNKLANLCEQYLRKGSQCYVEGKLQTRKWQDKDGQDRYTTEIVANNVVFLTPRQQNGAQPGGYAGDPGYGGDPGHGGDPGYGGQPGYGDVGYAPPQSPDPVPF
jgi:single-strand DNA-binding protein